MKILVAIVFCLLSATPALSAEFTLHIRNPDHDIGYIVGDTLTRTVDIDAAAPYLLSPASLPAKGVNRHGIELREVSVSKNTSAERTHYSLQLTYQVFTSASYARKVRLPREQLALAAADRKLDIVIPEWNFTVSPLSAHDETRFDEDMSPYRVPLLLDKTFDQRLLWSFLGLIAVSAIALLYFNGHRAWLPGMGGAFAKAHRKLRRLPDTTTSAQPAVAAIHEAFNQAFGANLFAVDIDHFLQKHPRFAVIRNDIEEFFRLSNSVLFGNGTPANSATLHILRNFCRLCRDCEREPFDMRPLTAITLCSVVLTMIVMLLMQRIQVLPMWPLVIAWACFFHLGGGEQPRAAMTSVLLSTIFGVFMGWLSALAILGNPVAAIIDPGLWAALVIAVFVGIISACAYWKPFSITPVCIYGYAANWGYLDVPGRFDWSVLTTPNVQNVILILPTAILLGCAFGYLNARLVSMLILKPQPASQAAS